MDDARRAGRIVGALMITQMVGGTMVNFVLAVAVVENISVMSMVSVSQAYAKGSGVEREQFQAVRVVAASARNWAHYMARIVDGVMVTSVAQPLFGHEVIFPLLAPLGLSQLVLLVWLMAKGFRSEGA